MRQVGLSLSNARRRGCDGRLVLAVASSSMVGQGRRALLGRIAEFGWFMQQGEPAATQALAMLLEDEPLREAFLRALEDRTGANLNAVSYFVPEAVHEDGARPDLEGLDDEGQPLIVVEAKFWAALEQGQVRSYLADQVSRLGAGVQGVFVLVVPTSRADVAQGVLNEATQGEFGFGLGGANLGSVVG
jgi:hypothetical protein